eukprot:510351-Alexandrium_andersonii.AAC.1
MQRYTNYCAGSRANRAVLLVLVRPLALILSLGQPTYNSPETCREVVRTTRNEDAAFMRSSEH